MPRSSEPAPVAEWDFGREFDPLRALVGGFRLRDGPGSRAQQVLAGTGRALRFDGVRDHLVLPADDVGTLDVARRGTSVSVFALFRRATSGTGFVAGMWQEDDTDPRRQYGLFIDLPTYGGAQQVIGHVSADGRPSDGLPYSRSYSATARMVGFDQWRVVGFTYDGAFVRSYLDGITDVREQFTERAAPLGAALTYSKNPFYYPHGLNGRSVSDFTVGAVKLTHKLGNFFGGDVARLAVWDTALSPEDAFGLARRWTPRGRPTIRFDFYRPRETMAEEDGGWASPTWPPEVVGWRQDDLTPHADEGSGPRPFTVASGPGRPHLSRVPASGGWAPSLVYFDQVRGLSSSDISRVSYRRPEQAGSERVLLAVRVDAYWYVTDHRSRDAYDHDMVIVDTGAAAWYALESQKPTGPLPEGEVGALGFFADGVGAARTELGDIQVHTRPLPGGGRLSTAQPESSPRWGAI